MWSVTLDVSEEEVALLRAEAKSSMESFHVRGEPDARQPHEWHDGRKLMRLAERLERAIDAAIATRQP